MTDTTTEQLRVVPQGVDALDGLTVRELSMIARKIGRDPAAAVRNDADGLRWEALGHLAWVWAKRRDPQAKLDTFLELSGSELAVALRLDQVDDDADDDPEANPTEHAPAS